MSKTDGTKIAFVVVLMGLALFFGLWPRRLLVLEVGEYAPDFTLPSLDTGSPPPAPVHLFEHRGQVVLVNFWATWCAPCVEETPSLEKLSVDMSKLGVEVISVSVDRNPAVLKQFAANYHLSFPIARDVGQIVASQYGTSKFPETYILDRDGRLAEKIIGARDWQDSLMVSFVESLARPGKPPA